MFGVSHLRFVVWGFRVFAFEVRGFHVRGFGFGVSRSGFGVSRSGFLGYHGSVFSRFVFLGFMFPVWAFAFGVRGFRGFAFKGFRGLAFGVFGAKRFGVFRVSRSGLGVSGFGVFGVFVVLGSRVSGFLGFRDRG